MTLAAAIMLSGLTNEHFDSELNAIIKTANILKPFTFDNHLISSAALKIKIPNIDFLYNEKFPTHCLLSPNNPLDLISPASSNGSYAETSTTALSALEPILEFFPELTLAGESAIESSANTKAELKIERIIDIVTEPATELNAISSSLKEWINTDTNIKPKDLMSEPVPELESSLIIDLIPEILTPISKQKSEPRLNLMLELESNTIPGNKLNFFPEPETELDLCLEQELETLEDALKISSEPTPLLEPNLNLRSELKLSIESRNAPKFLYKSEAELTLDPIPEQDTDIEHNYPLEILSGPSQVYKSEFMLEITQEDDVLEEEALSALVTDVETGLEDKNESKFWSEPLSEFNLKTILDLTSEPVSEIKSEDDSAIVTEVRTEPISDLVPEHETKVECASKKMGEPLPAYTAELLPKEDVNNTAVLKMLLKLEQNGNNSSISPSPEAAEYYLNCFDIMEREFRPDNGEGHNSEGNIYGSINKQVMYQKRDILDLASNVTNSTTWDFKYAVLETGIASFFENRSQLSRLRGAETPPHRVKRCRVGDCDFNEPVYL